MNRFTLIFAMVLATLSGCATNATLGNAVGAQEVHLVYDRVGVHYTATATLKWEGDGLALPDLKDVVR